MTTSEPTTGEIVSALRNCPHCDDCLRKDQKCYRNDHDAADRLESQERENASLRAENKGLHKEIVRRGIEIKTMTARAESAEAERDAAKRDIEEIMSTHGLEVFTMCAFCAMPDDDTCFIAGDNKKCKAKWRGLQPQDGEGK